MLKQILTLDDAIEATKQVLLTSLQLSSHPIASRLRIALPYSVQ